jgi:predicted GIY-YIG superfamily endonuclease
MSFPKQVTLTAQMQIALGEIAGDYCVYLLHFTEPVQTKRCEIKHYLGLTKNVEKRFKKHASGQGNGLVKAALDRGEIVLVGLWKQDGNFERKVKNLKKSKKFCPVCIHENKQKTEV